MIRIRVELSDPLGNRSSLEVEAQNIERALDKISASYPGCETRVVFPIDPEGFFEGGAPVGRPSSPRKRGSVLHEPWSRPR